MLPPDITITGNGYTPDNLKVKKYFKLPAVPLILSAKLKWNLHDGGYSFKYSCKDTIFYGKLNLDLGQQSVEYRKPFPLPLVGSRFGTFVARFAWHYSEGLNKNAISYRLGFEISQGGGAIVGPNKIRFKPHLFYNNFGVQAHTLCTFKLPQTLLFEMTGNTADKSKQYRLEDLDREGQPERERLGIDVDVQELNLVLRL